jgi:hypothetical protein
MSPVNDIGDLIGGPGLAPQPTWKEMLLRSHARSRPYGPSLARPVDRTPQWLEVWAHRRPLREIDVGPFRYGLWRDGRSAKLPGKVEVVDRAPLVTGSPSRDAHIRLLLKRLCRIW